MAELKPCPFCGGSVRFDKAYSYFRDSVIYCDDCDMVFTLDDCQASDDEICAAWNSRNADKHGEVNENIDNGTISGISYPAP